MHLSGEGEVPSLERGIFEHVIFDHIWYRHDPSYKHISYQLDDLKI